MRGKAFHTKNSLLLIRITPAYAGKRPLERPPTTATRDHPRLCGEKKHCILPFRGAIGSPPPMRGKAKTDLFDFFEIRITPAYAGKSCIFGLCVENCRDHPRLCGEKLTIRKSWKHRIGSPPPMRGKVKYLILFFHFL